MPETVEEKINLERFCDWHMATEENPKGTDCTAKLDAARVFPCRYTIQDIKIGDPYNCGKPHLYIEKCPSFQLNEKIALSVIEALNRDYNGKLIPEMLENNAKEGKLNFEYLKNLIKQYKK